MKEIETNEVRAIETIARPLFVPEFIDFPENQIVQISEIFLNSHSARGEVSSKGLPSNCRPMCRADGDADGEDSFAIARI